MSSPRSVLDAVRESCAWVAARANHVRIDAERLRAYADALPVAEITSRGSDPAVDSLGRDPELRAAYVIALDAVNFGSGYFPLLRKRPGHSGYRTVEATLRERFAAAGPIPARELATITAADCARLFDQTQDGPVGELMTRFAQAWRELGELIAAKYEHSFLQLARAGDGGAERLVALFAELPSYRDVARYDDRDVHFLKRAQITAADLALAIPELHLRDLDRLTLFADNLVPHVLRLDGVLSYADPLVARIEREDLLASGSPEEVEIRACGVQAVEQLCARVRARGGSLHPYQLDYWLWLRGGEPHYKARPRHRARSWYY